MAAEHPSDAGDADCHVAVLWTAPRNDMHLLSICTYFAAEIYENHCHCEPVRTLAWQSVPLQ